MSETKTITIAGTPREIGALPYGRLRKILPAMNRCNLGSAGEVTEEMMADLGIIVSTALGITAEEFDGVNATIEEVLAAVPVIAEVCGLTEKVVQPGEAQPG